MYSNELVCSIIDYIDVNLTDKITIDSIASHFFYNRTYIMKLFKKELGVSIFAYINKIKIERSIKFINECPSEKLVKVAYHSGFYSLEYFSEIFKKELGVSPRIYKKFLLNMDNLSYEECEELIAKILKLRDLRKTVQDYKANKKPKDTKVKVMSIFRNNVT